MNEAESLPLGVSPLESGDGEQVRHRLNQQLSFIVEHAVIGMCPRAVPKEGMKGRRGDREEEAVDLGFCSV